VTRVEPAYAHHRNPRRRTPAAQERASEAVANLHGWHLAVDELKGWPEYAAQPLRSLDHTAQRLGIQRLFYKDESERFGRDLASFKALGAPYAVYSLLADAVEAETGVRPSSQKLRADEFRSITEPVTVCVATDGNQGRGLAYAAKTFGCRCVTYIHREVSAGRKRAMERFGAVAIRVDGEYEASVTRAKEDAANNGWHFVSSTSWDAFRSPVPRSVMQAYMVVLEEVRAQLPDPRSITHVVVQGGVGSIAAAMFLGFLRAYWPVIASLRGSRAHRSGLLVSECCCWASGAVRRHSADDHGGPRLSGGLARRVASSRLACERLRDRSRRMGS
jgi:diaminopropionate ammonia-lyase